jgi:hypothetical protein
MSRGIYLELVNGLTDSLEAYVEVLYKFGISIAVALRLNEQDGLRRLDSTCGDAADRGYNQTVVAFYELLQSDGVER